MSIVFLKNWLFGNGRVGLLHDARAEGYGATTVGLECGGNEGECCAQVGDVPEGHADGKGDAGRSGYKGDTGSDGEATDVDLEAQESEGLLPARPGLRRSPTSRCFDTGSESSSQTRAKRVDARVLSDAIIGLSDGLTVPFALTAGLSTLGDVKVVIFGGLAELMAGAISMGLGGYLGAQSEAESYNATLKETQGLIDTSPEQTTALIHHIFAQYHIPPQTMEPIATLLQTSPKQLRCFIMKFYHNLPPPRANRAFTSAITIALGYFIGGFVPLLPYFFVGRHEVLRALWCSALVMAVSLFAFGYIKTCVVQGWRGAHNVWSGAKGGVQMVVVGGLAAAAAMGLVKAFN